MDPTDEQRAAIESDHPKILVTAGAGSGKTQVILARIQRLVERDKDPLGIAVVTYTNAAARVIEERLGDGVKLGHLGTLHSFCVRHLDAHGGWPSGVRVMDEEEAAELRVRLAKEAALDAADPLASRLYRRDCLAYGRLDYDMLLEVTLDSLRDRNVSRRRWRDLIVDEFQDAARIDYQIYKAAHARNLFLVCDPMQAIFGFRGGDVRQIDELRDSAAWERHELTLTFRCGQAICDGANRLASHSKMAVAQPESRAKILSGQRAVPRQP
jgi:DNA helicase-2/ATP-dependent DNA helicase PcrA